MTLSIHPLHRSDVVAVFTDDDERYAVPVIATTGGVRWLWDRSSRYVGDDIQAAIERELAAVRRHRHVSASSGAPPPG